MALNIAKILEINEQDSSITIMKIIKKLLKERPYN